MDIRNFNKKLNKIAALTDENNDEIQLSPLERDLLLSYIRDLYDIALDGALVSKPQAAKPKPAPVQVAEPTVVTTPIVETPKPEIKVEVPEILVQKTEPKYDEVLVSPPVIEKVPSEPEPKPEVTYAPKPAQVNISNDLIAELFVEDKVAELSDKLAQAPIKDLTKSMGINERIFTQQELFNNNAAQFNDSLTKLNSFASFKDAQSYIINELVPNFGWTNENKIKKAATFIKLVRRKYI